MADRERRRVLLLGDPVEHSLSPVFQNAGFEVAGISARYEACRVPPQDLAGRVQAIRDDDEILGANVTIPHKLAVVPLLDELAPEARAVGAVNTISRSDDRLLGSNTDVAGFRRALEEAGYDPTHGPALLVGAGGAARAVAYVLSAMKANLVVASRDVESARRLNSALLLRRARAIPLAAIDQELPKAALVVNATPVGLDGQSLPFPPERLGPRHLVFDLLYQAPGTPLVDAARSRGARAVTGLNMLLYQGMASFEIWTGRPAPEAAMRAALNGVVRAR